jgi:hypothetical protein
MATTEETRPVISVLSTLHVEFLSPASSLQVTDAYGSEVRFGGPIFYSRSLYSDSRCKGFEKQSFDFARREQHAKLRSG